MSLPWFAGWLRTHLARHCTLGLPQSSDAVEMYEGWESEFELHRISERAADMASVRVMAKAKPLRFHFEFLLHTAIKLMGPRPEPECKGATPPYVPPPAPRGADLRECVENARDGSPVARPMRLELRRYIVAGDLDPYEIPPDVLDAIANEPESCEPITPPRLRSANVGAETQGR